MKGLVGLFRWPAADGLPIKWYWQMVTLQLQVRCRPGKVRRSKTDVLPLNYTTNLHVDVLFQDIRVLTMNMDSSGLSHQHDGSLITNEFVCRKNSPILEVQVRQHTSHWRSEGADVLTWPVLRCFRLSSKWRTRLSSKLATDCLHVACQEVLCAAGPPRFSWLIMSMVLRLTLSAFLYRLRYPPREHSPCCS